MKLNKTAILPFVSAILFAVGTLTNHKFTADTTDLVATVATVAIAFGVNIYGIIKNHKKGDVK
jgi:hypothetical protein